MNTIEPILVLDGVFAGYGKMTILNGTTAKIRRGVITTVIGPNGAGKSTLFKTIFGLLPVRGGTITFDGRAVINFLPRDMLDAGVAYVPQGRNIFPELSVLHNLELGGVALTDQASFERTSPVAGTGRATAVVDIRLLLAGDRRRSRHRCSDLRLIGRRCDR